MRIRLKYRPRRSGWTIAATLTCVTLAHPVLAQAPDLVTDRPDQTESASVVPAGHTQIETGFLYSRESGLDRYEVPGTLFRVGVGNPVELRFGYSGVVGGDGEDGSGDTEIGAKVNLWDESGRRPEVAVIGSLSLPTGAEGVSTEQVDPSVLAAFGQTLSSRVGLGYNVGAVWESSGDDSSRQGFLVYSLALGVGLTDRLAAFVEVFGDRAFDGADQASGTLDGGVTVLVLDRLQLDFYVGRGINAPADDLFIGTGLSIRLPR